MQRFRVAIQQHWKLFLACSICLSVGLSLFFSVLSFVFLQKQLLQPSLIASYLAKPVPTILSVITFHKVADIEIWRDSLLIPQLAHNAKRELNQQQPLSVETVNLTPFVPILTEGINLTTRINTNLSSSVVAKQLIPATRQQQLEQALPYLSLLHSLATQIDEGTHTWLVLLQNSDELRATGGFLGSYALVTIDQGKVTEIVIEDVYDADGQFQGFIAAPAGVQEYLSGNTGLRLPNANWDPDFPSSSETILQFFALGDRRSIEGVVAVNTTVVADIVKLVEPVWLPDYQQNLTSENLTTILREERGVFFAGSQDKKQLLKHAWNQLKQKLTQLDSDKYVELTKIVTNQTQQKNIQFYSTFPELQQQFTQLKLSGEVLPPAHDANYLYFIESNVSINKANKNINRVLDLRISDATTIASYTIRNENQQLTPAELATQLSPGAKHRGYVNYQRIYLPVNSTINSLTVAYQPTEYTEAMITTKSGITIKEISFLVSVLEQQATTVTLTYTQPQPSSELTIQKQSGTQPYPLTIQTTKGTYTTNLDRDIIVKFQP